MPDAKKRELKSHLKRQWCISPRENAASVAAMEDALGVYCRPSDARFPTVNMDEQPVQLLCHKREPIPVKPGRIQWEDYEYKRKGTCSIFLFTEPLAG